MTKPIILPEQWRQNAELSQDAVARLLGVTGKNPAGTWRRWAIGANRPPLKVVEQVQLLSGGRVTTSSWIAARELYVACGGGKRAA